MRINILKSAAAALALSVSLTGCIDEFSPKEGYVDADQVGQASFDNMAQSITNLMSGSFVTSDAGSYDAYDFGYPALMIMRDIMGQDITPFDASGNEWFATWYGEHSYLGPNYAATQIPWTLYYKWISNCNMVIRAAGSEPSELQLGGLGVAYAMRAFFYFDLVRLYSPKTYAADKQALTVPKVDENTEKDNYNNPRMTNEKAYEFILADLDKAEQYIPNYSRNDVFSPDLSVVYGIKARVYLTMENWAKAEEYAKKAMEGYEVMTGDEYTDISGAFATPNSSWMFGLQYLSTDDNIKQNDGDSSWGSKMITESGSGCGYAANYGYPLYIDRHLYETVPATDFRKKCFVNFHVEDDANAAAEAAAAAGKSDDEINAAYDDALIGGLTPYSARPDILAAGKQAYDGLEVKFRNAGGTSGLLSQYTGFCVAVPLMRVEEMKLIEAEAVGMQEGRLQEGISLLTAFAKSRDPQYVYGKHNEAYGNAATSAFQNEVWWQRRIEFWGEGLATFDIKRLGKGIVRSYEGTDADGNAYATNHVEFYRWNLNSTPGWMTYCITGAETRYNTGCTNNPTPQDPDGDSEPVVFAN